MSPAKSKTPAELAIMSDRDLRTLDAHLKAQMSNAQRLRSQVNRERNRRRRARKVGQP
jgi:uncharacterized protein